MGYCASKFNDRNYREMKPLPLLVLFLLLGSPALAADEKPAADDSNTVNVEGAVGKPSFEAVAGRDGTRIRFLAKSDKTIIDITSKFGIDKATIQRKSDIWPKSILVRLHLRGLESFQASNGDVAVEWSVSSTGENAKRVSLRKGRKELALDEKNPYYSEVRLVSGSGKIPLKDGYFDVPLPAKLFEANPKEITLRWIDFYRN
jgi:hypothetical protein